MRANYIDNILRGNSFEDKGKRSIKVKTLHNHLCMFEDFCPYVYAAIDSKSRNNKWKKCIKATKNQKITETKGYK